MKKIFLTILFSILIFINTAFAQAKPLELFLFYSDGCSHCAKIEAYIQDTLLKEFTNLQVQRFEVSHSADNQKKYADFALAYGVESQYVPAIFIGDKSIIGEDYTALHQAVEYYNQIGATSPEEKVKNQLAQNTDQTSLTPKTDVKTEVIGWSVIIVIFVAVLSLIIYKYLLKKKRSQIE